jgi:hypothetical protein
VVIDPILWQVVNHCNAGNGRNKWFDKPMNQIVFENGRSGLNGNHSWADAIVVVKLMDVVTTWVGERFRRDMALLRQSEDFSLLPAPTQLQ